MIRTEIIVHGQKLDIFPDTEIAITFQQNDLKDIVTRQFSYSTDFSLPLTNRNIRLLGHANQMNSGSGVPYRYIDCAVLSEGVQITDNAILQIVEVSDVFKVFITERSVPFWQAIDGLNCRDAYGTFDDATQYINGMRTAQRMFDFNTFTGDNPRIVYPLAYFGRGLDYVNNRFNMDARYQYPAVFASDIVTNIITKAGYTLDSPLVNNIDYQRLALLYAGSESSGDTYGVYNLIPDTSQKEFLKIIGFLFGVDFVEDPLRTNVIITRAFDAALSNSVIDWSGKINFRQPIRIERFWGNWAKENRFVYDNDGFLSFEGQGIMQFGNSTLAKSYTAFELPYSASRNITDFGGQGIDVVNVPRITALDDDGQVSKAESLNYRLVFIRRVERAALYTDFFNPGGIVQNGFLPYAYFPDELELLNVIDSKYKLLKSIFGRPLKITAMLKLTASDIATLDLGKLVYIDDSYRNQHIQGTFLINKINNYVPGRFTEVELIEVGASANTGGALIPDIEPEVGYLIDSNQNYLRDADENRMLNDIF